MPLITFEPKSSLIENVLALRFIATRKIVKDLVHDYVPDFPLNNIIVNLGVCKIRNADPDASDYVVFLDTCPNEDLEKVSNNLCLDLAVVLINSGRTKGFVVEVWPRFLPGPWCIVKGDKIIESVSHPRTAK